MMGKTVRTVDAGKRMWRIMAAVFVVVAFTFAVMSYVNHYYEATEIAEQAMKGNSRVEVVESDDYYLFLPDEEERTGDGIIFYPGGKVEERAYAPLMLSLAECGYEVYLMRMPARLAVLRPNAADLVIGRVPEAAEPSTDSTAETDSAGAGQPEGKRRWILMGHSLGGAMAANYAGKHSDEVSLLVLLAAYSTADLSDTGIDVLSFYGSEDGVLNREKYDKNRAKLPKDTAESVIDGGNHAGFGFYGEQKGDGPALISREEQQEAVVDALCYHLENK